MNSEESVGNVRVICRFRPLNDKEKEMSNSVCANFYSDRQTVGIMSGTNPEGAAPLKFTLDYVFTPDATQAEVYEVAAKPIVESVMQGFNGTVFAYGQTSSGKTFTMTGSSIDDQVNRGIIPRMVRTVFQQIHDSTESIEFTVKVAYSEIYMERIKDLLDPSKSNLKVKEDKSRGIYIDDLTEEYVSNDEEVYDLMRVGTSNREVAYTHMNAGSSRSHSIFMITIAQNNTKDLSAKSGKLYLVDLAGSEKISKTGAEGKRLDEAKNINKSLTALGMVINALTDGKSSHVPYRDSKLTRVLQDSLGGNSKTSLIITCSPSFFNEAETIGTLRFGVRAKSIKNKPKINREYTVAELKLMLAKAQEQLSLRDKHISDIEKLLKQTGVSVPLEYSEEPREEESDNYKRSEAYSEMLVELDEVKNRLEEEMRRSGMYEETISDQKDKLERQAQEFSEMQFMLKVMSERVQMLENHALEKDDVIEQLQVTRDTLTSDLQTSSEQKLQLEQKLTAKDIELKELAMNNHHVNAYREEIEQLQASLKIETEKSDNLTAEVNLLRNQLEISLRAQAPSIDIESIKRSVFEEAARKEREKWIEEKKVIARDLQNRIDKVVRLEIELDESRERYKNLEGTMTQGQSALMKKSDILEKNLEQLTVMYHQLVSQKSILQIEKKVAERKTSRLNDKVQTFELQLKQMKEDIQRSNERRKAAEEKLERYEKFEKAELMPYGRMSVGQVSRIKKTIKGGGATPMTARVGYVNPRMLSTYSFTGGHPEDDSIHNTNTFQF